VSTHEAEAGDETDVGRPRRQPYGRSKPEQQSLGQIEPRVSLGITGKGNNHSYPSVPRAPRG